MGRRLKWLEKRCGPHSTFSSQKDAAMEIENEEPVRKGKKKKELDIGEREQAIALLLDRAENDVLPRGSFTAVAKKLDVHADTISRLWRQAKTSRLEGKVNRAELQKKERTGRPAMWNEEDFKAKLITIPLGKRRTMRAAAKSMGCPKRRSGGFIERKSGSLNTATL